MTNNLRVFHKGVRGVRKLYPSSEIWDIAEMNVSKDPDADYYESIYLYNPEHVKILEETRSLSGIKDVVTDRIVLDFDSKDLSLAQKDTQAAFKRLSADFPEESIQIYHSANKGFHLVVQLNETINRETFENAIYTYGDGLPTFDEKVKDEQRLFRFPLTKHVKTGRYKVPLTPDELYQDIGAIVNKSANPDFDQCFDQINAYRPSSVPKWVTNIVKNTKTKKQEVVAPLDERPDMSKKPKHLTPAKYVLQMGFFEEGERNEACMILASTYKYLNYDAEEAFALIKTALRKRSDRLGLGDYNKEELWTTIVEPVFSPNWKGGTFSEEDGLLKRTIERYNLSQAAYDISHVKIEDVGSRFVNFAENIDQNIIKTGIGEIDNNVLITTGMMVGYLGAPSSGKTTSVINILEHQSINDIPCFFQSSDMPDNLLYVRLIQKYCGWDLKKILFTVKAGKYPTWPKELRTAWDLVLQNFKNVGFSFRSGPTVKDIENNVDNYEQKIGKKVKVLAVDYLEKIRCDKADATAASGYNASMMADLTRDKDLATLLLLQPQKSAGDPSDELLSMRKVKGASVIEQDCRIIMTQWRPGFNPNNEGINYDDCYASIAVVKNNMGPTCRMDFRWDGATGRMNSLDSAGRDDLKRVIKEAKERKNSSGGQNGGDFY